MSITIPTKLDFKGFKESVKRTNRRMTKFQREMSGQARAVQNALRFSIVIGGLDGLKSVNQTYRSFEDTLLSVQAKTGQYNEGIEEMGRAIRDVAKTSTKTATEVAGAAEQMALLGFSSNEIKTGLEGVIITSEATGAAIEDIARITGGTVRALGLEADQFGAIGDLIVATANNSATTVEELGTALEYASSAFSGLGLSAEEGLTILGQLANVNIKGSKAGTALRGALAALARDLKGLSEISSDAEKELGNQAGTLRKFGLSVKLVDGDVGNFKEMLASLREQGAKTADYMAIFGTRAGSSLAAMSNATMESSEAVAKALRNAGGTARKQAEFMRQSLNNQWKLVGSAWQEFNMTMSESGGLVGAELSIAKMAQSLISFFQPAAAVLGQLMKFAAYGVGIIGTALAVRVFAQMAMFAVTPVLAMGRALLFAVGVLVKLGIAALANPMTWIILGITAAVAGLVAGLSLLYTHWDTVWGKIKAITKRAWLVIKGIFLTVVNDLKQAFWGMVEGVLGAGKWLADKLGLTDTLGLNDMLASVKNTRAELKKEAEGIVTDFQSGLKGISSPEFNSEGLLNDMKKPFLDFMEFLGINNDEGLLTTVEKKIKEALGISSGDEDDQKREEQKTKYQEHLLDLSESARGFGVDTYKAFAQAQGSTVALTQTTLAQVGGMFSKMGEHSKKFKRLAKLTSIAEAIYNTYTGATLALRDKTMPTWARIAASFAVIGSGLASVRSIRGQAHAGLENVPATGTYLLQQGEMVASRNQNEMLTDFLKREKEMPQQPVVLNGIETSDGGFYIPNIRDLRRRLADDEAAASLTFGMA